MEKYQHQIIEKKWQAFWQQHQIDQTPDDFNKPKYYILDMFPYPSGAGLHVGHPKGYIATDIYTRYKRLRGFNVLHPMGFDAFGLPAENYAIKHKIQPQLAVAKNISHYRQQLEILGLSYDWDRTINTTDPEYYRFTQWIFLQMFKRGLAFESYEPINWCPSCQTGLANEDLEAGKCERCGTEIEKKPLRQWVLKITDYAERLLDDLALLPDWEASAKDAQRHWIGKSVGAEVDFKILKHDLNLKIFTTRVDTIFGCTYVVLAPEHQLIETLKTQIENFAEVDKYCALAKNKSNLERTDLNKTKTGVKLQGIKAINPFNQEAVEVFVADYVLHAYGTGAVMAVPAHDERDHEFAHKYNLEIRRVIIGDDSMADGTLINSGDFTGLSSVLAREKMTTWLEAEKSGSQKVNYKLQDWVFSRQRYWGEPIPLIHCEKCGVVPVPEAELPLILPLIDHYTPTGTGESPLADIASWVNTTCPQCGGKAKRETNTMPQWAGSSWYYLRYLDPHNSKQLINPKLEKYWQPVDFYVGGAEHITRHLIYARFWHKFLYDLGVVSTQEPFLKLKNVGLIIGEDGRKMSKRWGNVINPDEIVASSGADALRVYEMFMCPFEQASAWNTNGLLGARRFLDKVWLYFNAWMASSEREECGIVEKTILKVGEDIESFHFNTAISQLMICFNELEKLKYLTNDQMQKILIVISPFAPHLAEEMWSLLGEKNSIFKAAWPQINQALLVDAEIEIAVQINGKWRDSFKVSVGMADDELKQLALLRENVIKWTADNEILKVIVIKGKLINIVLK